MEAMEAALGQCALSYSDDELLEMHDASEILFSMSRSPMEDTMEDAYDLQSEPNSMSGADEEEDERLTQEPEGQRQRDAHFRPW